MNYRYVEHPQNPYIECLPGDGLLASERDALELVAACGEYQASRLMLHAVNLPDDFYHLRTGLAGAVLQKFANYLLKVAAVLTPELVNQGRFKEMVLEANRGNRGFHVFYDREQAEEWLVRE
jgi:hypothetical protein